MPYFLLLIFLYDEDREKDGLAFEDSEMLTSTNHQAPVGSWPEDERLRRIGHLSQAALESDIEGYVLFIANVIAGWSREEILVYIAQLRREIRSGKHHASFKVKAVWGRRPF